MEKIPIEILQHIGNNLSVKDLKNWSQTSKYHRNFNKYPIEKKFLKNVKFSDNPLKYLKMKKYNHSERLKLFILSYNKHKIYDFDKDDVFKTISKFIIDKDLNLLKIIVEDLKIDEIDVFLLYLLNRNNQTKITKIKNYIIKQGGKAHIHINPFQSSKSKISYKNFMNKYGFPHYIIYDTTPDIFKKYFSKYNYKNYKKKGLKLQSAPELSTPYIPTSRDIRMSYSSNSNSNSKIKRYRIKSF